MINVVVGGVIEKDDKVLMVQETLKDCCGKWNLPAGRLKAEESLIDCAKREIKEETGCDVEIIGLLKVSNRKLKEDIFVYIIFLAKLLNENIQFDKNEILDVKWIKIEDVLNKMDNSLRSLDLIKQPIINLKNNIVAPLDLVKIKG